jgi:hypothetical protein
VDLFVATDSTQTRLTGEQRRRLKALADQPWLVEPQLLRVNSGLGSRTASTASISVADGSGRRITMRRTKIVPRPNGGESWTASENAGTTFDAVQVGANVVANLRSGANLLRYEPLGDGLHVRFRVDHNKAGNHIDDEPAMLHADSVYASPYPAAFNFDASMSSGSGTAASTSSLVPQFGSLSAVDNGAPYVKVLAVYTSAAAQFLGSTTTAQVQGQIDETNTAYANSGIQATLLTTSVQQIAYTQMSFEWSDTIMKKLSGTTDGFMDNVHSIRAQERADVVALFFFGNNSNDCGQARNIGATNTGESFVVVNVQCFTKGWFVLAHEIGHLFGARHDVVADDSNSPFAYGHGYVDPQWNFRDIMSDPNTCPRQRPFQQQCPVVGYFSTPNRTEPSSGLPLGTASSANTVQVHNVRSWAMRDLIAPAPPSSFSQVNFSAGQRPRFSWPKVSGVSQYQVFRCGTNPWGGGSSCSTVSFSYFDFGSTMQLEDVLQTLANNTWNCPKQTRYYVTSIDLVDGFSVPSNNQPVVCLQ